MEVRRIPNSELYHHGIKGQEWGDRNGPPYPLDSNPQKQAAKKKKVGLIQKYKNKKKGKQLQKAKAAKKAEREEKQSIINSGDANLVKKNVSKLSDEELSKAINKIELNAKLNQYTGSGLKVKTAKTGADYVKTISNSANMVKSVAEAGQALYKLSNMLSGEKKKEV